MAANVYNCFRAGFTVFAILPDPKNYKQVILRTIKCLALSQLQHLEKLRMEIPLTPAPLAEAPPVTHNITEHLAGITTPQQALLIAIGIHHIQDLATPDDRNWTAIAYANEKPTIHKAHHETSHT